MGKTLVIIDNESYDEEEFFFDRKDDICFIGIEDITTLKGKEFDEVIITEEISSKDLTKFIFPTLIKSKGSFINLTKTDTRKIKFINT